MIEYWAKCWCGESQEEMNLLPGERKWEGERERRCRFCGKIEWWGFTIDKVGWFENRHPSEAWFNQRRGKFSL